MIILRCDRCKQEYEHPIMYSVVTGHIGVSLPKGWEIFNGQNGMQQEHRNKHICPQCAEEYHFGFLRTPVQITELTPTPEK
jgi:hypothetical protein